MSEKRVLPEPSEARQLELLAYAKVCFEKCTNPFDHTHLLKKNVKADECIWLSYEIADVIHDHLESWDDNVLSESLKKAEKEFQETQE